MYFFPLQSDTNKKHCPQLSPKVTSGPHSLISTQTAHTLNIDTHFSRVKKSFVWVCTVLQAFGRESNRNPDNNSSGVHQILTKGHHTVLHPLRSDNRPASKSRFSLGSERFTIP